VFVLPPPVCAGGGDLLTGQRQEHVDEAGALVSDGHGLDVHGRRTDEPGDKHGGRLVIQGARAVDLLEYTIEQHAHPVAHGHRLTRRAGRPPSAVAAGRGYGEARVEADLHDLGVRTVAIPAQGQPGPARRVTEHRRSFRTLVKRRTGSEGRVAHLKRRSGWDRTRLDGL